MTTTAAEARHHYHAHADRSWTDLVTNAVLLSGFDVGDYLLKAATREFPIDLLGPVLHEVAHHACFDSVVGCALSALHMRARRYAFLAEDSDDAFADEIMEDLIRYETATRLLRPLGEGLGLFAEFDAIPGRSDVISPVVGLATLLFGTHTDLDVSCNVLLQTLRFRKAFVRRKASLLAEPFSCESGYLPGYMAVKYFFRHAGRKSRRAADRDLFLSFLRTFFYADPGFAAVILNAETSGIDSASSISSYFQQRIGQYLEMDLERALEEFEGWVLSTGSGERGVPQGIGADDGRDAAAWNRISGVIASAPYGDDAALTVAARDYMILEERALLHVGRKPVTVTAHPDGTAAVTDEGGQELPGGKFVGHLEPGSHPGLLSLVFSTDESQLAFVVVVDRRVVFARPIIGGEGQRWQLLCRSAANRPVNEDLEASFESALNRIRSLPSFAPLAFVEQQSLSVADSIYTQLAVDPSNPHHEAILDMLRASGFYGLLDEDRKLVEAFAAIGLANTVTKDRTLMAIPLTQMGTSLGDTELRVNTCEHRWGERFLLGDAQRLFATI
jgi:hypothetical protein